jgi:hypothetical protein
MGKIASVEDIVDAVLYLSRAGLVTGEVLHVDGGVSIQQVSQNMLSGRFNLVARSSRKNPKSAKSTQYRLFSCLAT